MKILCVLGLCSATGECLQRYTCSYLLLWLLLTLQQMGFILFVDWGKLIIIKHLGKVQVHSQVIFGYIQMPITDKWKQTQLPGGYL